MQKTLAFLLGATFGGGLLTQTSPAANLRVTTDANNSLIISDAGACGAAGPATAFANIMLKANASSALVTCGGGGTITGADTQVTFFDGANTPAGDAGMTYAKTTDILTVVGAFRDGTNYRIKDGTDGIFGTHEVQFRDNADTGFKQIEGGLLIGSNGVRSYTTLEIRASDNSTMNLYASGGALQLPSGGTFGFTADVYANSAADTVLARVGVGTVKLTDGGTGLFALSAKAPTSIANVGANSCGTSAATLSADSTNSSGTFVVGATAGTQCRITFSVAAPNKWYCTANNDTTTVAIRTTPVSTTTSDFLGAFGAGDNVNYFCTAR